MPRDKCVVSGEAGVCLVIVACGRRKRWDKYPDIGPLRAEDAYTSPVFSASRRYAQRFGSRWLILSAKYGFVDPDFVIPSNYNVSFYDPEAISDDALRHQVETMHLTDFGTVAVLGSAEYWDRVERSFRGSDVVLRHVNGNVGFPPSFIALVGGLISRDTPFPDGQVDGESWKPATVSQVNLCAALHDLVRRGRRYSFPFDAPGLPKNGIYVLFEAGEQGHDGSRIVRVGTHRGAGQLPSRMRQHFMLENKDRSIFRKQVGRALLSRARDVYLAEWEHDRTSRAQRERWGGEPDPERRQEIEAEVTSYLREHFSFVVFKVDDEASRRQFESRLISTVSLCQECRASDGWLGRSSPKPLIRESGLWNEQGLYGTPLSSADVAWLTPRLT